MERMTGILTDGLPLCGLVQPLAAPNALGSCLVENFASLRRIFEMIQDLRVHPGVGEP